MFHQTFVGAQPSEVRSDQLADAQSLFDQMPLDTVPEPRRLPIGSYMPLGRNALFVGREGDFKVLMSALKKGAIAAIGQSAAITGLGGIGKTQLASELAYRYGHFFSGGVFWLNFSDPEGIPAEVAACGGARALNLHPEFDKLPLEAQIGMVSSRWHSDMPRLLIFDNCEDEALLEHWTPRSGGCCVLVTSRRAQWRAELGVKALPLGVLEPLESVALLIKHRPDLSAEDPRLAAIAEELGNLPLALHMAGSFLKRYQYALQGDPDTYLAALQKPSILTHRSMMLDGKSPTGHEQHVARTFALSFEQLDPRDPIDALAITALARAAWFARGEPIPRDLLRLSAGIEIENDAQILVFEDSIARLSELGLIDQLTNGSMDLHRLLAAFVHSVQSETNQHHKSLEDVAEIILTEASRLNQEGFPAPLMAWQPHLREVTESAVAASISIAPKLLNTLGGHLKMIADLDGAETAYKRALSIDEKTYGSNHARVAIRLNNLGSVLFDRGNLNGAKAVYERALDIGEKTYGPDHPTIAIRVNNLGGVLQAQNDLDGAKNAYERALAIGEKTHGPDHPTVAIRINNLGGILQAQEDFGGAKAAYERAILIAERAYSEHHPTVATYVNNLGSVLMAMGDLVGAKLASERALAIFENAYGREHPSSKMARENARFVSIFISRTRGH